MSKELPRGWFLHTRSIGIHPAFVRGDEALLQQLDAMTRKSGESCVAFNLVRKVRAPAVYGSLGFYTGLEGYFYAHCDEREVERREHELGLSLAKNIKRLSFPLRGEVRRALEGTAYSLAAIQWLDAELGAMLARLRCVGYQGEYNTQNIQRNRAFQRETYAKLETLDFEQRRIHTDISVPGSETLVSYPLPEEAAQFSTNPRTEEELALCEIGKFGLPLFRAIARRGF